MQSPTRSGSLLRLVPKIALAALFGALTGVAFAVEVPLTLANAQKIAVERSRQLHAKDHEAAASREMAVAARQLPDPMLRAGVENLPVSGAERFSVTRDFMTMRSIGLMQEITRADKRRLRGERFELEAERSSADKQRIAAAIERDTALAWLERYYAEAMAAVIEEQGRQAKLEVEAADAAYRAGRGSQAEAVAARSAVSELENRASEAERRARNAKIRLARWLGSAADGPLGAEPAIDAIRLDAATLETRLAHHPEIAVLRKQEALAETEARLAQANKKPDWSVEVMYQQRGPDYSNMVSVGVSIPLQWNQKNRQDRELAAKLALVEQAKAEREDMLRAQVAETQAMINEWQNGRQRHARFERELIPLARQRTAASLAAYRGGKALLTDVLAARRSEIDVRLQALQLQAEVAGLWAQLNFLFPSSHQSGNANAVMHRDIK